MIIRILILLVSLVLLELINKYREYNSVIYKTLIVLFDFLLAIPFAFREYMFDFGRGYDYYAYVQWFEDMSFERAFKSFSNIGFNIYICILKQIGIDFHGFLLITSLIITLCIIYFVEHNSSDFVLAMYIYVTLFYLLAFNILRQCIACAVFLLFFDALRDRIPIKYLLGVIIATSFHSSALFLAVLFLLFDVAQKKTMQINVAILICGIILFIYNENIMIIILNLTKIFGMDYLEKYSYSTIQDLGNYTKFAISLVLTIVSYFIYCFNGMNKKEIDVMTYLSLSTVLYLLGTRNIVFNRFSVYSLGAIIIGVPIIKRIMANQKSYFAMKALMLVVFAIPFM